MKKIKLLAPLLACSSVAAMILPALTSCGQSSITMDSSKEQTTDANLTSATYEFKVSNYSETDDEIETEIVEEETETTDDVQVSISKTYYDSESGKYFVIVTISKEDGSLYDQEEIKFSLNINCHNKTTGVKKWGKKFDKLHIKHLADPTVSTAHFDDTDVAKHIYQKEAGDHTITMEFPIPATEKWTDTETEYTYGIDKLKIYAIQTDFGKAFSLIQVNKNVEFQIKTSIDSESQVLFATIGYTIPQDISISIPASFYLLFTYKESTEEGWESVFQTIGGFKIINSDEPETIHAVLEGSRERHVYKEINNTTDNEYACNYISFWIDKSYNDVTKFEVKSSNQKVTIKQDQMQIYQIYDNGLLVVPYTLTMNENHEIIGGVTNVTFSVGYTGEDESSSWKQTFKGLSFFNSKLEQFAQKAIISCDKSNLPKELTVNTATKIDGAFSTISPFDLSNVIYSTGLFTTDSETYTIDLKFEELIAGVTDVTLYTSDTTLAGKTGLLRYIILLSSGSASYLYEISNNISIK